MVAKKRATYEDVLAAPRNMVAEIVDGVLHTHARPAAPHARASSALGGQLDGPFDRGRGGPGGWILLDEPELHLGEDVVVPGLAGWRRERMPRLPMEAAYFTLAPDWLCEVVSPSTQAFDRAEKMDVYAREGVRHAWLVDPLAKMLEVWRPATVEEAFPNSAARVAALPKPARAVSRRLRVKTLDLGCKGRRLRRRSRRQLTSERCVRIERARDTSVSCRRRGAPER